MAQDPQQMSIGFGWDAHRLGDANKPLVVAGMKIPNADSGPLAHSDGDSALHALIDALFGCIGEGDIGEHFPDDDPRYKNIPSVHLLRETLRRFWGRRFHVVHVDLTVILDAPPLARFRTNFQRFLSEILSLPKERISIKFKHTEGIWPTPVYAAQCAVLACQDA